MHSKKTSLISLNHFFLLALAVQLFFESLGQMLDIHSGQKGYMSTHHQHLDSLYEYNYAYILCHTGQQRPKSNFS